jgi:hypothetical protein
MSSAHGAGKQGSAEFACQSSRNPIFKEKPNMTAISGPGPFDSNRNIELDANISEHSDIILSVCFVKIHFQKAARFIRKHWIDADNNISSQVILNDIFIQSGIQLVFAFGTGNFWFAAYPCLPLIKTNR